MDGCDVQEVWGEAAEAASGPSAPPQQGDYSSRFRPGMTARHGRLRTGRLPGGDADLHDLADQVEHIRHRLDLATAAICALLAWSILLQCCLLRRSR